MDRLSELPDSLIFHIFWLLPITDVVRTTIVSKRWKNLWTDAPYLNFYDPEFEHTWNVNATELRNFLNRALLRWNGVRVLKFKVDSYYDDFVDTIKEDTDLWVHFAKHNQAEELYLHIGLLDDDIIYNDWVPQCLYSCSSLKVLSIRNYDFRIKGNVQWNHLKSLTILDGYGVTEDAINRILCGSPQLEVLIMCVAESGKSLCIRSTSLKELSIYNHLLFDDDGNASKELRIWTPNLKTLEIKGSPYNKCLLMNVSSLYHATFRYSGLHYYIDTYCDGYSGIDDFSSKSHFLGDLFGQILPSIQHVENVTLLPCCVQVLGAMIEGCMNSSYPNVKLLRFRFYFNEVITIEIFPLSKKLVIKVEERWRDEDSFCRVGPNIYREFEENLPMSFVLQLRTVEFILEGDIIFPCLEFMLKNASKLEKIVFRVKGSMQHSRRLESLFHASQKLIKMLRSSRTAEFTFCEY